VVEVADGDGAVRVRAAAHRQVSTRDQDEIALQYAACHCALAVDRGDK